jgi:HAD superfamily hydrolase (TIGR01548 family)
VLVTAGGDDAIDRAIRGFVGAERTLILPVPTFEMFERNAVLSRSEVIRVPWRGGRFPIDDVLGKLDGKAGMVAVVSPNNPIGGVATFADLRRLSEAAGDALVFFDHAYAEYADDDLTRPALDLPNVVVLRTFSKAWGLAGCRVGYVMGPAETVGALRAAGAPFAVSMPSLVLAAASLATGEPTPQVARVRAERSEIETLLSQLAIEPWPSQGNFVSADFGPRASFVRRALAALGVIVRGFADPTGLDSVVRITMPGDEADCLRLNEALRRTLAPEALLLDLDGVLADVEHSYRSCVLATCESFGVTVTRGELLQATLAGDANNDWVLTQRLLEERGVEASLEEITARYQDLYLGTETTPGLRERERLIVPTDLLARLRGRGLRIAVVTGRPRSEAEWFLTRSGVNEQIDALVTMEDGPVKPDPTPVRLALERLDARRAWMVGDTLDDVHAAAAAGAVPIGVVAPAEDPERVTAALTGAGAAVVLRTLADIEELLP